VDSQKNAGKPESIRQWYERTTRNSSIWLAIATVVSLSIMTLMLLFAPLPILSRMQTGNGALTIPLVGALWIFAFIFKFLVPSREASFRAQETLEGGIDFLRKLVEEKVVPAVEVWHRVGLRVEQEYPAVKEKVEAMVLEFKETAKKVDRALLENGELVKDARPVLQALKKLEERLDEDLLEDVKLLVEAARRMGGMPAQVPPKAAPAAPAALATPTERTPAPAPADPVAVVTPAKEPDLSATLSRLKDRKKAAPSQPA
jgi:hypothetical protein